MSGGADGGGTMKTVRDHMRRETIVIVSDEEFEREGVICKPGFEHFPIPRRVGDAIADAAYRASPRSTIDRMREKRRRNNLRRFPWTRK
jgi:hypothetical protein